MRYGSLLGRQVRTELKIRRYVFYTLVFLSLLYVAASMVFSEMGLIRYFELKDRQAALEKETRQIKEDSHSLQSSIKSLNETNFYVEKNARENFGLAGPDEFIFIYRE
jgi:cell division protein FtsB